MKSNIEALKIHLTDKQIEFIESVQDFEIGFPGNFVGDDPRAGPTAPIIAAAAPVVFAVSSASSKYCAVQLLTGGFRNLVNQLVMIRFSSTAWFSSGIGLMR